jgi:hypothetical protein
MILEEVCPAPPFALTPTDNDKVDPDHCDNREHATDGKRTLLAFRGVSKTCSQAADVLLYRSITSQQYPWQAGPWSDLYRVAVPPNFQRYRYAGEVCVSGEDEYLGYE